MAGFCEIRLLNVICLGFAFTLIFTAFQTCSMVEQTVIKNAKDEPNSTFKGDGYTSLSIIYGVFAVSNWFAPSVIAVTGPKVAMLCGGVLYSLFIASFLKPMTWALYLASVLVGFGAAILWTGQGNFLTLNSDVDTIGRNSGIFWALLQCSLLFGNLYIYFTFRGTVDISSGQRITLFIVLSVVSAVGVLLLLLLRSRPKVSSVSDERTEVEDDQREEDLVSLNRSHSGEHTSPSALDALKNSLALIRTKEMILLSIFFAYTGFELAFWSGVLGTSVGATSHFGSQAKSLLGLVGILVGAGEIVGGAMFGIMGKRTIKHGRDPIVMVGYLTHIVALFLIYLSLPADSPLAKVTSKPTYITPNAYVILLCAFLLGFGDSSFNTQIYSILGTMYPDDSAPAFAIFKFTQSVASALSFVYSQYLILPYQLLILVVFGTTGTWGFISVEWSIRHTLASGYREV